MSVLSVLFSENLSQWYYLLIHNDKNQRKPSLHRRILTEDQLIGLV